MVIINSITSQFRNLCARLAICVIIIVLLMIGEIISIGQLTPTSNYRIKFDSKKGMMSLKIIKHLLVGYFVISFMDHHITNAVSNSCVHIMNLLLYKLLIQLVSSIYIRLDIVINSWYCTWNDTIVHNITCDINNDTKDQTFSIIFYMHPNQIVENLWIRFNPISLNRRHLQQKKAFAYIFLYFVSVKIDD